jgi:pimeloyl-ACP methyl ester carboxylesterase
MEAAAGGRLPPGTPQRESSAWRRELENWYVSNMFDGLARALAFAGAWRRGAPGLREEETEIERGDRVVPATLLRPDPLPSPLPAWIVLHGITRPGRRHPTLLRFVRALASSGAVVLVPEIPEWRALLMAPEKALDTLRGSILSLVGREESAPGRIGAMGFSFGVSAVLAAASNPSLAKHLGGVAGFGGHCDLERTLRFLFLGEHEWKGRTYLGDPDPYGRWVVGGNYLDKIPGFGEATDVAEALLELAREAGDLQVGAWQDHLDASKERLRRGVHSSRSDLFRALAPPAGERTPRELAEILAPALALTARETSPLFEPARFLDQVTVPVRLIHGKADRLIPFSESLRLRDAFPPEADVRVYLTALFAHSQRHRGNGSAEVGEQIRFLRVMTHTLGML